MRPTAPRLILATVAFGVFVAADDRVTLRGMVPLDALRTADGPAPSR